MKLLRLALTSILSVLLLYGFDAVKLGPIPPLGRIFSPGSGFWQNAERSYPKNSESAVHGLREAVDVFIDSNAIAHISASNNHDLYFMQGYITARDRLWQMDFTSRVAAGRLSEIIGGQTLEVDRFFRRIGLTRAAHASLEAFRSDVSSWEAVTAYSDGVNAWINELSYSKYPIEFKLLHYAPEPWEPLKCALMAKLMAFNLAGSDDDVAMTKVLTKYGRDVVEKLFPDFPDGIEPVVPGDWSWVDDSLRQIPVSTPTLRSRAVGHATPTHSSGATPNGVTAAKIAQDRNSRSLYELTAPNRNNGSNNWALSGSKTATGKPLLANDTHLSLWLPCTWYMIQLTSPDVNVMGATLPGAPSVIIGFNDSIAWGVTNAQRDVRDWYSHAAVTSTATDTIRIRGRKPFYDQVSFTNYGPIVYDETFAHSFADTFSKGLAMSWAAMEPSNELAATLALNRAKNFDQYLEAIERFECPGQNFVFASVSGDIAIKHQGKFPAVTPTRGKFILSGAGEGTPWGRWIPSRFNPMMKNPDRGFVSSANQHPTGKAPDELVVTEIDLGVFDGVPYKALEISSAKDYPYYYRGSFEFFRNRRINSKLESLSAARVDDMRELQGDTYSLMASELLPVILKTLKEHPLNDSAKACYDLLANWDSRYSADSKGAVVFDIFYKHLYELTLDEFRPLRLYPKVKDYVFIQLVNSDPDDDIFDIRSTQKKENARDIIAMAFDRTPKEVQLDGEQTWAESREVRLQHATRAVPAFDMVLHVGGEGHCINALDSDHGPAWRMIVSLEDGVKAWAVYPGGQSGNPGSRHYVDFADEWARGELLRLVFLGSNGGDAGLVKQTFVPKN